MKPGSLKSIFNDGTKLFVDSKNGQITVTEKNCEKLFYFLYNNWEKVLDQYFEVNRGQKTFVNTVNWYIPNTEFDKIAKGIEGIENSMLIMFPENQKVMRIMNETLLNIHKEKAMKQDKNPNIIDGKFKK